jgi:hypothetical protein
MASRGKPKASDVPESHGFAVAFGSGAGGGGGFNAHDEPILEVTDADWNDAELMGK